jgi:hypothetical protein
MRLFREGLGLLLAAALTSCGGGGGGGGGNNPPPPALQISYPAPPAYTRGVAITPLTPTVAGGPQNFQVNPPLPAGLTLDTTTGIISGTPTSMQAATTYTVLATSGAAQVSATVSITVNDQIPAITYPRSTYSFMRDVEVNRIEPTRTSGGLVTSWSIDQALPAGMTFDTSSGAIAGTPTALTAPRTYVVTATNSGGSGTFSLAIDVTTGIVLDLGHVAPTEILKFEGSRFLARDLRRHVLWDADTGAILRRVVSSCAGAPLGNDCPREADLAGVTMFVRQREGWDLYASTDGAFIRRIARDSSFDAGSAIASDGSYLLATGGGGLRVFSTAGTTLFTRSDPGYTTASFFAAAGEIRAANAPSGTQVIETIAVPGGALTVSAPFAGAFAGWFLDGERFFTTAGNTVRVYSRAGAQLDIAVLPSVSGLGGNGEWYWTTTSALENPGATRVYRVGSAGTPAATYLRSSFSTNVVGSGSPLALLGFDTQGRQISVVDLSGVTPVRTDFVAPLGPPIDFAAVSASQWVFSVSDGVLSGELGAGTPQRYSHGAVRSIAGSDARVSLATSAGEIRNYDAATRTLENVINQVSTQLALSADGAILGAGADVADREFVPDDLTLRFYSLPSRSIIDERLPTPGNLPLDFALSASGEIVARTIYQPNGGAPTATLEVTELDGTPIWNGIRNDPLGANDSRLFVRLSSTGERFAVPDREPGPDTGTNIYLNGVLAGAATGWPAGWIDDGRLLQNRYSRTDPDPDIVGDYLGAAVVDPTGLVLLTPALTELRHLQAVGAGRVYSSERNIIFDTTTGNPVWSSTAAHLSDEPGAVAGNFVWFASGATIVAEPR